METVKKKLVGHYNYYGITDNYRSLMSFYYTTRNMTLKWLNRRSQKKSYTQDGFSKMWEHYQIPTPRIKVSIYAV